MKTKLSSTKNDEKHETINSSGTLILDATYASQHIRFPQDASLLDEVRIKLEEIIDILFEESDLKKKPRTYRKQAKKVFLQFCKSGKRNNAKKIRKIVKKLLSYVKRDLR